MPTKELRRPEESEEASPVQPLTAEEARRVREQNPGIPVVGGGGTGGRVVAALLAWLFTGKQNVGWSVGYGAWPCWCPRRCLPGADGKFSSINAGSAAVGFLLWEMVKIALTFAMLVVAPRLVAGLSWPALLIGLILAMKVYWLALAFAPRPKTKSS